MNKVGSLVQNFEDDNRDQYEDVNNIRRLITNKGDQSDRLIGYGLNTNEPRLGMDKKEKKRISAI